jgi:hypothetical protein
VAIILEGPDAAGKTTLGRLLAGQFGMDLIVSGGAPRNEQEVIKYCDMQLGECRKKKSVLDRITPISHPVYNPTYRNSGIMALYLKSMLKEDVIVVYCRPPTEALMRPEKHVWKDYDTEDHKQKILNNQMVYIDLYDEAFNAIPHLEYDYTQANEDYTVELIAMLAATQHDPKHMVQLKQLQRYREAKYGAVRPS